MTAAFANTKQKCNFKTNKNYGRLPGRRLKDKNGVVKANTIKVKIKDDLESEMIVRDNEVSEFYVTENKQTRKLETLFIYDAKTDK